MKPSLLSRVFTNPLTLAGNYILGEICTFWKSSPLLSVYKTAFTCPHSTV